MNTIARAATPQSPVMRATLRLAHARGFPWERLSGPGIVVHYKGNAWEIGAALERWLATGRSSFSDLAAALADLPWHFAMVVESDAGTWAFVDRLRTHPLFYAAEGDRAAITDDPYALPSAFALPADDPLPLAEFQLAGYVLGGSTLSRGIKALQAGEALRVERSANGRVNLTPARYVPYPDPPPRPNASIADESAALMADLDAIFEPLLRHLDGRQIVLPLSAGIDSRIVAAMLKRHGYPRVLAYTYGRPRNWEAVPSEQIARALGLPWHFVEYSRPAWRRWYASGEMREYLPFASRHVSTPHIQDWPAVLEMKRAGLLDDDAVFMPGHTAVLVPVGLDPRMLGNTAESRMDALVEAVFGYHFALQRAGRVTDDVNAIKERIRSVLPPFAGRDQHAAFNAYMIVETTERQAKLVLNSMRAYEFFGHRWVLPLWHGRLIDLWASVPWQGRLGKVWLDATLAETNFYGLFERPAPLRDYAHIRQRLKDNRVAYRWLKRLKCLEHRVAGYFHSYLDWYGVVGYPEYVFHMGRSGNMYSILSRLYLRDGIRAAASRA